MGPEPLDARAALRKLTVAASRFWRQGVQVLAGFEQHVAIYVAIGVSLAALSLLLAIAGPWPLVVAAVGMVGIAVTSALFVNEGTGGGAAGSGPDQPSEPAEQTALWRAMIEAMPEPAIVLDDVGLVVHHNAHAAELLPKLRRGLALSSISRAPELIEAVDRARTAEGTQIAQIVERVPVERHVQATVARLAGARGPGEPAMLVIFRDLSEQDRLDQMRQDFIANASHELRTPLASLRGFVETLQGPAKDDPVARERFLAIMASQAMRMTRLIDDLLTLSRIEMRQHLAPRGIVDLNEVAAYVAQTLEPLASDAKIAIKVEPLSGPARIGGDRDELVQVVSNLVQNAIKYGRPGGNVWMRIARDASSRLSPRIELSVVDDGPGIAPQHLPRLTERFYRVNVTSSREKGGTGLGLAIVKHIVNRHRGELRIASTLGKGSSFTVGLAELPAGAGVQASK